MPAERMPDPAAIIGRGALAGLHVGTVSGLLAGTVVLPIWGTLVGLVIGAGLGLVFGIVNGMVLAGCRDQVPYPVPAGARRDRRGHIRSVRGSGDGRCRRGLGRPIRRMARNVGVRVLVRRDRRTLRARGGRCEPTELGVRAG